MHIGVLALQGDFSKHSQVLRSLGIDVQEVRMPQDLNVCDGLIIPGGESTTMMRQIDFIALRNALIDFGKHKPLFGTCAGLIIISNTVKDATFEPLKLLEITVERNAYGRQIESFHTDVMLNDSTDHPQELPAFFIRAPRIQSYSENVKVLAEFKNEPVLVQQGHLLGATFHPELTSDPFVHQYFIELINSLN
jgi:5'-phosphate synthase pdxT subunit